MLLRQSFTGIMSHETAFVTMTRGSMAVWDQETCQVHGGDM
jgi:hypothetical protein